MVTHTHTHTHTHTAALVVERAVTVVFVLLYFLNASNSALLFSRSDFLFNFLYSFQLKHTHSKQHFNRSLKRKP